MSTRAMICVDWYGHDHYELFYRHCDGYPTAIGMELVNAMLKHDSIEEVIKEVGATQEGRTIDKPEDAFLKVQSDLEWIYVIRNGAHSDTMSLQIYKTSCPYTKRNFAWPVWFSYKTYIRTKRALLEMSVIELTASNTLYALHEFEKAKPAADPEQSGTGQEEKQGDSMTEINCRDVNGPETNAREELARYAACVFEPGDVVEVRRLPCGQSTWHQAGKLAEVAESLLADNQHKQHIHVGANRRRTEGGTRSKDVACGRCLFVDFDGIDHDAAQDRWHKAGLPAPTLTIASGHGVHAYWRLVEPITDMVLWSALQKKLIGLVDSDSAIHDPARIMRLPGFTNHKDPVAPCRIINDDQGRIYNLKSLIPLLDSVVTEAENRAIHVASNSKTQSKKLFSNSMDAVKIAKLTAAKWAGVTKGGRNHRAFQNAAYLLKNLTLTEEQAWPILRHWNCRNKPPLPEWELRQATRNANTYGRHRTEGKIAG